VAYAIKQSPARRLVLERGPDGSAPPIVLDLDDLPRPTAILTVIRAFLDETIPDGPWFLDQLGERAEVAVDSPALARRLFTDWDQVRQHCAGAPGALTIGSHGHGHHRLAGLDGPSQRFELIESKRILESRLECAVTALAYPYGWPGCYTVETKSLAAEAGYRLAFAAREGVNRPDALDRFEIRRLGVGSGDSPVLLRGRTALHAAFGKSFL
jgi:hypothetical protein